MARVLLGEKVRRVAAAAVVVLGAPCLFDKLSVGTLSFVRLACPAMQVITTVAPATMIMLLAEKMWRHERAVLACTGPRFALGAGAAISSAPTCEIPRATSTARSGTGAAVHVVCAARLALLFAAS